MVGSTTRQPARRVTSHLKGTVVRVEGDRHVVFGWQQLGVCGLVLKLGADREHEEPNVC